MIDFQVKLFEFHNGKIRECVTLNDDGTYTIFVESTLSRNEQYDAVCHALKHIYGNDFDKDNADFIELMAHC